MPPFAANNPRLRILSVGGNPVSAFLSWRLQATNSCDVVLVWKSGYESVSQYGISFKSTTFGNERFKPRDVVRTPEDASKLSKQPFDYVLLCVKALPDVYDLASIIESVVTPQHTCILVNTTHSLGIESLLEKRYPKNVVLSLVSAAEITQLGIAEFEHNGNSELWVGPANANEAIPASIQNDMSEALAMTLGTGQVTCHPSKNIQQQQFERLIGPIAFHCTSVLFETPNHAELLTLTGVRDLISDTIDELIKVAESRGCSFSSDFKSKVMTDMVVPTEVSSLMFQDYAAHRPMEIETYLGSPLKLAKAGKPPVPIPRLETLYAMLHHVNVANQKRKDQPNPPAAVPAAVAPPQNHPSRMSSNGPPRGMGPNGHYNGPSPSMRGRGSRAPSMNGPPPGMMRRGPPPAGMNGYPSPVSPMAPPPSQMQSFEEHALDEDFAHIALYGADDGGVGYGPAGGGNMGLRERELMLRQKEMALRERELAMRGGPGARRPPPSQMGDFDEEDGEDYFDPMAYRGPPVDPDNIDMMSVTSRRGARKTPSVSQLRSNPELGGPPGPPGGRRTSGFLPPRPSMHRNRVSSRLMEESMPDLHQDVLDNPLMEYSSDRYGGLDRNNLGRQSRTSSLTAARLNEMQGNGNYGAYPPMGGRRTSHSPATPMSPGAMSMGPRRPSPGQEYAPNGMSSHMNRPSPPDVRQPTPRHPPGHGNAVAPHQVEQRAGVSNLYPPKQGHQVRSLTGSASASAGSGDSSRSTHDNSAYSSQSSLGPRPPIGVR